MMRVGQACRLIDQAWNETFDCLYMDDAPIKIQKHPTTGKQTTYLDYMHFAKGTGVQREFNKFEIFGILDMIEAHSVMASGFGPDRWLVKAVFEEGRIGWLVFTLTDLGNFEPV